MLPAFLPFFRSSLPLLLALLLLPTGSSAGLISNGSRIRDTETGLEYVRMAGNTLGQFPARIVDFRTKQWLVDPSYRMATAAEARSLLGAVGLGASTPQSIAAFTAVDTLMTFFGPVPNSDAFGSRRIVFQTGDGTDPNNSTKIQAYDLRTVERPGLASTAFTNPSISAFNGTSAHTGALLTRSVLHGTAASALAGTSVAPNLLEFSAASGSGIWFDLGGLSGPNLQVDAQGGAGVTHVGLSSLFSGGPVTVVDPVDGVKVLRPGEVLTLSSALASVVVEGLGLGLGTPGIGSFGPSASPSESIFLAFDQATTRFSAAAVTPEPELLLLLGLTALGLRLRARLSRE